MMHSAIKLHAKTSDRYPTEHRMAKIPLMMHTFTEFALAICWLKTSYTIINTARLKTSQLLFYVKNKQLEMQQVSKFFSINNLDARNYQLYTEY